MVRTPLLWGVVVVLFLGFITQVAIWRKIHEEENQLSDRNSTAAIQKYKQLQTQIVDTDHHLQQLEKTALWGQPHQLLPLLGKVARGMPVELVGVEALPPQSHTDYLSMPLRLTFSGNYEGFSAFIAVVEKATPPIRIDGIRFYQKERQPDTLWMSLTISPMSQENWTASADIQIPSAPKVTVKRNPFAFETEEAPPVVPPEPQAVAPETPFPRLTGILWDEENPLAIFTDHQQITSSVPVGKEIAGAKVIEIHPQTVVLMRGEEMQELRLWKEEKGLTIR